MLSRYNKVKECVSAAKNQQNYGFWVFSHIFRNLSNFLQFFIKLLTAIARTSLSMA